MPLDLNATHRHLSAFEFEPLFREQLGWDRLEIRRQSISVDDQTFVLSPVSHKRGFQVFECSDEITGQIPAHPLRRRIERQVMKIAHEHLLVFVDKKHTTQVWQWVRRQAGKPSAYREHTYHAGQSGDSLIQRLQTLAVSLDEEEETTLFGVGVKVQAAFDVERVTKKFYDLFKKEHDTFLKFLGGIPDKELERWYVSVMLNRLMFIYFIQKKGFLNRDTSYLKTKLVQCKAEMGKDRYYRDLLCPLFFEGFAKQKPERSEKAQRLLGDVPYLNGGIFMPHQIEQLHGKTISIPDKAFDKLFEFFDAYSWHLDERPLRNDNEINPDVLGYIFEKYINQKQMGAYYTKEDITGYISRNTVIPFLFDAAKEKCKVAFETGGGVLSEGSVWRLLQEDPDRYIYPAVRHGISWDIHENRPLEKPLSLPPEIEKGVDAAKPNLLERRKAWNRPAPAEYALPTEIWREVVARRKRYEEVHGKLASGEVHSINDLITYNLDISQFAEDVIDHCEGPELLMALWKAIERVTVLDPTCGSGAFLFAALNILEPLYEACLERMKFFLNEWGDDGSKNHPNYHKLFADTLKRVEEHPNQRYFIFKSIVVNNLYGVDIMEEAVEICKLRLFLKLVAQVDAAEKIEPLPDIDFNIRAGNTLVGFVSLDEVKKTQEGTLGFGKSELARIQEQAEDVDQAFQQFHRQQTELGGQVTPKDKKDLADRLKKLADELDCYLAGEYGIDLKKKAAFAKWRESHKPFHWLAEFYGILKGGGFDVIIGNPPYVDYGKVTNQYTIRRYKTEQCGNLYAFCIERSLSLLGSRGQLSMIVPLSVAGNAKFQETRRLLLCSGCSWLAFFSGDTHPGTLFSGVQQNLCIFIHAIQSERQIITTSFLRFADTDADRDALFPAKVVYAPPIPATEFTCIPKIGHPLENSIIAKLRHNKPLSAMLQQNGQPTLWYHNVVHYWFKCFKKPPFFQREHEPSSISAHYKSVSTSIDHAGVACACLTSSAFYLWYILRANGRDVAISDVVTFPFDSTSIDSRLKRQLEIAYKALANNLEKTKRRVVYEKSSGQVRYDQYWPEYSKMFIDEIDKVLAKHYGFTDEELDFIINYDIKYRMGQETGEEDA